MMNLQPLDAKSIGTRQRSKPQILLLISHLMSSFWDKVEVADSFPYLGFQWMPAEEMASGEVLS